MMLSEAKFADVIAGAPLACIDLIIRNRQGDVLLGKRRNRPAMGYWFVPGGRIRKNERTQDALQRIAINELGGKVPPGRLMGIYDHIYDDNFFGIEGVGTHCVTIGIEIVLPDAHPLAPDSQHTELVWWKLDSLLASEAVHSNTRLYFVAESDNGFRSS